MLSSDRFLTEIHKNKIQQNNKTNPSLEAAGQWFIPPDMLLFVLIIAHWRFYKYSTFIFNFHVIVLFLICLFFAALPNHRLLYYMPRAILLDFLIGIETTSKLRKLHTNTKLLVFMIRYLYVSNQCLPNVNINTMQCCITYSSFCRVRFEEFWHKKLNMKSANQLRRGLSGVCWDGIILDTVKPEYLWEAGALTT